MTLIINGFARETSAAGIAALIAELGLQAKSVLIEHNGTALRRDEWPAIVLREHDRIEILRIAAGG